MNNRHKPRVLLLEPNRLLLKTYENAWKGEGFAVLAAQTAEDAISLVDQKQPDIVVIELLIAEHNGIEFLYEFVSYPEWQCVPVYIYTRLEPAIFERYPVLKDELSVVEVFSKQSTQPSQLILEVRNYIKTKKSKVCENEAN